MGLFDSPPVLGIAGDTLSFVLNAAEQTHPREYMGFLRTERAGELGLDRKGRVIILGKPYGWTDWQAFDSGGSPTDLDVLDVDLPENEFVEMIQAAIEADREREATSDEDTTTDSGDEGLFSWFR
jgi:hypothetical protein